MGRKKESIHPVTLFNSTSFHLCNSGEQWTQRQQCGLTASHSMLDICINGIQRRPRKRCKKGRGCGEQNQRIIWFISVCILRDKLMFKSIKLWFCTLHYVQIEKLLLPFPNSSDLPFCMISLLVRTACNVRCFELGVIQTIFLSTIWIVLSRGYGDLIVRMTFIRWTEPTRKEYSYQSTHWPQYWLPQENTRQYISALSCVFPDCYNIGSINFISDLCTLAHVP